MLDFMKFRPIHKDTLKELHEAHIYKTLGGQAHRWLAEFDWFLEPFWKYMTGKLEIQDARKQMRERLSKYSISPGDAENRNQIIEGVRNKAAGLAEHLPIVELGKVKAYTNLEACTMLDEIDQRGMQIRELKQLLRTSYDSINVLNKENKTWVPDLLTKLERAFTDGSKQAH
jgi:hypothetical protein